MIAVLVPAVVTSGIDRRVRGDVAYHRGLHLRRVIRIVPATGQRGGQRDVQPYLRRSVRIQVPQTAIRRKADRRGLVVVCALFLRSMPAPWGKAIEHSIGYIVGEFVNSRISDL